MPGDEHKIIYEQSRKLCKFGHYLFHQVYTDNCISRTTSRKEVNKMAKCFSCPGAVYWFTSSDPLADEDFLTRKFITRKFLNTKISRFTVHLSRGRTK